MEQIFTDSEESISKAAFLKEFKKHFEEIKGINSAEDAIQWMNNSLMISLIIQKRLEPERLFNYELCYLRGMLAVQGNNELIDEMIAKSRNTLRDLQKEINLKKSLEEVDLDSVSYE